MAFWNAPSRIEFHELAATQVALEMQGELMRLSKKWDEEQLPQLRYHQLNLLLCLYYYELIFQLEHS